MANFGDGGRVEIIIRDVLISGAGLADLHAAVEISQ
jgi:hypothetical protein